MFICGVCIQLGVSLGVVGDSSKGVIQSSPGGLLGDGIFHTSDKPNEIYYDTVSLRLTDSVSRICVN